MRTTVNLNAGLLREAKRTAAERRTTLTQLFEEALQRYLRAPAASGKRYRLDLPVIKGRRPPAVDINRFKGFRTRGAQSRTSRVIRGMRATN